MAARRTARLEPAPQVQVPDVDDEKTQRAFDALTSTVQQLQRNRVPTAPSVTGSRSGGDALQSLLSVLAEYGIITDDTTP